MSWAILAPVFTATEATKVKAALDTGVTVGLPPSIAGYIKAGVSALQDRHGGDVLVTVTGNGHLCDGPDSHEVTTATLEVRLATPEEIEAKAPPVTPA